MYREVNPALAHPLLVLGEVIFRDHLAIAVLRRFVLVVNVHWPLLCAANELTS